MSCTFYDGQDMHDIYLLGRNCLVTKSYIKYAFWIGMCDSNLSTVTAFHSSSVGSSSVGSSSANSRPSSPSGRQ